MGRIQLGWFGASLVLICGIVFGTGIGRVLFGDSAQAKAELRASNAEARLEISQKKFDRLTKGNSKAIVDNARVLDLCLVMLNILGWHVDDSGSHIRFTGETLASNGEAIDAPQLAPGQQNRIQNAIKPAEAWICEITKATRELRAVNNE